LLAGARDGDNAPGYDLPEIVVTLALIPLGCFIKRAFYRGCCLRVQDAFRLIALVAHFSSCCEELNKQFSRSEIYRFFNPLRRRQFPMALRPLDYVF
jgi:hypothetical protein